jgi:hypothetical protein
MWKYVGNGFLPGLPARDLADDEVELHGFTVEELVTSGLYKRIEEAKREKRPYENKIAQPSMADKEE